MSWIQKLYETYPFAESDDGEKPWPDAHVKKNAHIELVIDKEGNFLRATVLEGNDSATLIPVTEKSAARTGNIDAHPLCEELSYCALDLSEGVKKKSQRNKSYLELLNQWCDSSDTHSKVVSVRKYVSKATLWADISRHHNFPLAFKGKSAQKIMPDKCFVRWKIEEPGNPVSGTWEDESLIQSWIIFEQTLNPKVGFCYVTGREVRLAKFHPKYVRHAADGARFVTQNDWDSFTFLGRFTDSKKEVTENFEPSQVCEIAYEVTQKAHNTLRWLIARQGSKNGDQVVVAWAVSGKPVPTPITETASWNLDDFGDESSATETTSQKPKLDLATDLGQRFGRALEGYMAGYFNGQIANLQDDESVVIMGLDSATPGRMAITYYRDFRAREYVQTIELWHIHLAWPQRVTKEISVDGKKPKTQVRWLPGAPSPWAILQAAYGDVVKSNEELKRSLYERLLPCILENQPLPADLIKLAVGRASNPNNSEYWEWERNVGVACALFCGFHHPERQPDPNKRRSYAMALDLENRSRDYLYGRLLAVAEHIEETALRVAKVERSTTAARLMQRFSDRPFSTWKTINDQLQPYIQQLVVSRRGYIENRKKDLDSIMNLFQGSDFTNDKGLSGEYLLGFHCQRMALRETKEKTASEQKNQHNINDEQEGSEP